MHTSYVDRQTYVYVLSTVSQRFGAKTKKEPLITCYASPKLIKCHMICTTMSKDMRNNRDAAFTQTRKVFGCRIPPPICLKLGSNTIEVVEQQLNSSAFHKEHHSQDNPPVQQRPILFIASTILAPDLAVYMLYTAMKLYQAIECSMELHCGSSPRLKWKCLKGYIRRSCARSKVSQLDAQRLECCGWQVLETSTTSF